MGENIKRFEHISEFSRKLQRILKYVLRSPGVEWVDGVDNLNSVMVEFANVSLVTSNTDFYPFAIYFGFCAIFYGTRCPFYWHGHNSVV